MTLSEKVAYLKGLAEGMELDTEKSKEGKLISVMIGMLEEMAMTIEDLEDSVDEVYEALDVVSDDLGDVEEFLFGEDDDWDEDDDDDDCCCGGHGHCHHDDEEDFFHVAECPKCGSDIYIDASALEEGSIQCPDCEEKFGIDLNGCDDEDCGCGCGCGCETEEAEEE
jgi:hypothetical protein